MLSAAEFTEYLLNTGLAQRSVYRYSGAYERAKRWADQHGHDLATCSPAAVRSYAETLPLTYASRSIARAGLRHYWLAIGRPSPPLVAITVPPQPRMVCKALEPDDAALLAKAAQRGDRRGLAVALGLYLGLRREEIATLRWASFTDGWVKVMGKGKRTRVLLVHPTLARLLAEHPHTGPYIFPGRGGGHVCNATIWSWVRQVGDEAGVGLLPSHRMRHTALAKANDETGDLRAVQEFAGHATTSQTSGYTRASTARMRAVVASLDY